ncbi:MAG: histone deacetylase [Acidobacteriota bacterium]
MSVFHDDRMLGHHPTGWDPDHPEWTAAVKELLAAQYGVEHAEEDYKHPERPERLEAVRDRLQESGLRELRWVRPGPAGREELGRVHTREHLRFIESLRGRHAWLDLDTTAVSPGSVAAAALAAGAGVSAVEEATRAFCLVRPPGHHAFADRAKGFCLYNNVAVAAAHARAALGCRRVLIVDWDMHHGNGTQEIFYRDPDVLFFDTHCEAPFYPGSGLAEETGSGAGLGATINVPLPRGSGNAAVLAAFERILVPAADAFRPEIVLVSAGFDAHHLDQTFTMDETGFAHLCHLVRDLADRHAEGRIVLMLEGGYHAESLSASAVACMGVLAGRPLPALTTDPADPGLERVATIVDSHRR